MNGKELVRIRKGRELLQSEIADRMGLTRQRVSAIETSERVEPVTAARYLAAIDVSHVSLVVTRIPFADVVVAYVDAQGVIE